MKWFVEGKWGAKSLVALYLSVLSGLVLALQYDLSVPFYSTGTLELIVPFGAFWRSLHFFSSQFFFLLLLVHLAAVLTARYFYQVDKAVLSSKTPVKNTGKDGERWLKLVLSVPVALLLLFTGYILRADATGASAGIIAENIIVSIPLVGNWLNSVLFNISSSGMKVVYANHLIGLGVFWGYLVWEHLRKYRVSWRNNGLVVMLVLVVSLIWVAPIEPFSPGVFHISGPWFFIGLQEMLRIVQPVWAGIIFPGLALLLLYQVVRGRQYTSIAFMGGVLWCVIYLVFTFVGLFR
ncbi:MAG: cytochrome b N-terminal domain-containing protein [Thermodesulfobacteriota bacterium]